MRLRKDLAEVRPQPPVAALQLFNALSSSLALSVNNIVKASQMVYILPERLLALVRPAFDLVLQRIRSLKRCVQA